MAFRDDFQHGRFSLQAMLESVAIASIVLAYARCSLRHGILALGVVVLGIIWYLRDAQKPAHPEPFSWPRFAWTGIKCTLGGLFLAMAASELVIPLLLLIRPLLEDAIARTALTLAKWEIRSGAMDRLENRLGIILFLAVWWLSIVVFAAGPGNVQARWATSAIVAGYGLIYLPEVAMSQDVSGASWFAISIAGTAIAAFAAGWVGDTIRTRRQFGPTTDLLPCDHPGSTDADRASGECHG